MGAFFVRDFASGLVATALLGVLLSAPGYLIGWTTDVWHFRARSATGRTAASVVLSVAVVPALAFLVARVATLAAAATVVIVLSVAAIVVVVRERSAARAAGEQPSGPLDRRAVIVAVAWTIVALALLSDLQIGRALYPNVVAFDYAKHISVTDAVTRTGVPPLNPSFQPGHGIALYYYYVWFLVCSLADLIGGRLVDARGAVFGGTVVAGLALVAVVALYARLVFAEAAPVAQRRRLVWIAVALLLVGGLDVVAMLVSLARGGRAPISLDWWNEQVTMWTNSVLWVPHHVASFVAGSAAFLVLLDAPRHDRATRAILVVVAGMAIASGAGMSIWVTLAFGVFWAVWVLACLVSRRWTDVAFAAAAGGVAILAAAPFLRDLAHASMLHTAPIAFSVRPFKPLDDMLDARGAGALRRQVYRAAALPLNYAIELGFFAFASIGYWWRRWRSRAPLERGELGVVCLAVAGLLVASFLKSAIRSNDLGWRSMLLVQFATLLWSAAFVAGVRRDDALRARAETKHWPRRVALVAASLLLSIGVASSAYDLAMMKLYLLAARTGGPLASARLWGPGGAETAYDLREAYAWASHQLPADAVVQPNPAAPVGISYFGYPVDVFDGLYSTRPAAAGDGEYGTLYGVPRNVYDRVAAPVGALFADSAGAPELARLCRSLAIRAWLVTVADSSFHDRRSWVWREPPLFANRSVRLVGCPSIAGRD